MPADPSPSSSGGIPRDPNGLPRGLRHDLINALNAINGFASILEMDLTDPAALDFVRRIQQAGAEAMRLAGEIPSSPRDMVRIMMVSADSAADGLAVALEGYGCDVTLVENAAQAAQALRRAPHAWDLVLCDMDPAAHTGFAQAAEASGLPLLRRDPAMPSPDLALLLRHTVKPGD